MHLEVERIPVAEQMMGLSYDSIELIVINIKR